MEIFKTTPKINFLGHTWVAFTFSAILIIAAVYIWVKRGDEKYGIDFRGGFSVLVKINEPTDSERLENALRGNGLKDASVQSFELGSPDYVLRMALTEGLTPADIKQRVDQTLREVHPDKYEVLQTDSVGATIGAELRRKALWAISLGLIGVLVYLAFRFPFSFGLGAVVGLFHDVIVSTGIYLWLGRDINGAVIAAALTIVGYSVNDTIVVFDRVREFMHREKNYNLAVLMNESMNSCFSRTIITTGLTWSTAIVLLIFGGGAIQDLVLYLSIAIFFGAYSTVYICSPVVLLWERRWGELVAVAQGKGPSAQPSRS
jgi:preprotein translocase SecF subunit